ncbi:MAG: aminoacyl-tRNA hydrolase [bacterium]|nr:aminoacyl-tRNA hydrolase [bacterium]
MYLIAGLGNPGKKYTNTRHNLGFWAINELSKKFDVSLQKYQDLYEGARLEISDEKVILAQPLTFMNKSGEVVRFISKKRAIPLDKILIIYDDLNLPLGKFRMRPNGSAGGHNGMTSIIECLGSSDFPRLRVGIGSPDNTAWEKFVLQSFSPGEKETIQNSLKNIPEIVEIFIRKGIAAAMEFANKGS